jgi:hypothetical protein
VGGARGTRGRGEESVQVLVGRPEGKRQLGRPRSRWENGIRTDLRETDWEGGVECIQLAHDRDQWRALANTVMKLRILSSRSYIRNLHSTLTSPQKRAKNGRLGYLTNFFHVHKNNMGRWP